MIHWLWLIPAFVSGVYLCALLMGICAAAGREDAWWDGWAEGFGDGHAKGYAQGQAASMRGTDPAGMVAA